MRNVLKFSFVSPVLIIAVSGCNVNISMINDDIFQYKDSFVGDNSAVGNIANQLADAEQLTGSNEQPF
ncbi:hypothetical protein J27TS8_26230 [Robertmurraya siralis]|uniref:Uncharacterized protein n=1 Tax=Robertmurraya siralis TaxID=77777 RepID=A0A920BTX3_9BACI|nr:DUF4825 domain-containing protein [Robertmurraya siralis]GIN62630.1 hypothetical protein J27TS8_26230 [Robertmurraya siralis]